MKQLILLVSVFFINICDENSQRFINCIKNIAKRKANAMTKFPPNVRKCGAEFACVRFTKGSNDCDGQKCAYYLAYERPSATNVEFYLSAVDAQFAAIGFASDMSLRNTEIIACVRETSRITLKIFSWAGPGHELEPIPFSSSDTEASLVFSAWGMDYYVECLVSRAIIPWEHRVHNLNDPLYQIYLWGDTDNGIPNILSDMDPYFDWHFRETQLKSILVGYLQRLADPPTLEMYKRCGQSRSCVRLNLVTDNPTCTHEHCSFTLLYSVLTNRVLYTFLGSAEDADYVAVGFTRDSVNLVDTEIIGCKKSRDGKITSFHYLITNMQQIANPQEQTSGLKLVDYESRENGLWCYLRKTMSQTVQDEFYQLYFWGRTTGEGKPIIPTEPSELLMSDEILDLKTPINYYEFLQDRSQASNNQQSLSIIAIVFCLKLIIDCI